jgi:carbonic anhydrase/acetyltransferase-like protein (isoleucine patch superfamily)
MIYFDPMIGYQCEHFEVFCDVVDDNSTTITENWVISLNNINAETFAFCMVGHSYQIHIFNVVVGANQLVCKDVFLTSIAQVKTQCFIAIEKFITKLDRCFVDFELMNPWHCISTILDAT